MRIIVNAGAGGEEPAPWAEYFRGTRAHNVVSVAGAEQRANGRVPAVSDVHWVARAGLLYFSGTHDGFARLALDLRLSHRRRVCCLPGRFWLVCAGLLGSGQWDVESFTPFPPEVRLMAACHGHPAFVASRSDAAAVEIVPAGVGEIRMTGGVETPAPQGWYAARHGERRPAPVVSLAASVRLPFVFGYALVPRADGPTGDISSARQLRTGLAGRHALASRDDAEVVVHLYEERGVQCVKALRGAFAVALWDERLQRLLLARDQLGLVPLFYAADGRRLAAASSLPALVALPALAGTWDPAALEAFVTFGLVPPPSTVYAGIRQLGPGEMALWEDGRLRTQRYWQLTYPERRMTRADLPRLIREQLLDALRLRQAGMVSGLLLSGGLDAAALLALAAADHRLPARAYTAAFADGDAELGAAAEHAARAGVEHATVGASPDWPAALDRLLAAHGGPVGGPEVAALQLAATRARGEGDILLAGVGGEGVFGGSPPRRARARNPRHRALPALAREGAQLWACLAPTSRAARLRRLVEGERLAPLEMDARAGSHVPPAEREALFTPRTLALLGEARPWDTLGGRFAEAASRSEERRVGRE